MFPAQNNNRLLPAEQPLFFDDFITRDGWRLAQKQLGLQLSPMPATNIYETETDFFIELAVPGLTHEDLTFFTAEDRIEIRYEPDASAFEPYGSRRTLHREYRPMAFHRIFQVSTEALDLDGLQVHSRDGIVHLRIPKRLAYHGALPLRVPFSLN